MNTQLNYLSDTYVDKDAGVVLRVGRDERGAYIVLDQTIFYPQGGGQPSDTGTIRFEQTVVNIHFVGFNEGEVFHYCDEEPSGFDAMIGQTCELQVDQLRRLEHARLHTAGHLIASIVDAERGSMRAIKGFHFSDGPHVEFEGKPEEEVGPLLEKLQAQVDLRIADDLAVTASMVTLDELKQCCWQVPDYLPDDKPLRVVRIGELDSVPCGGTHIANLSKLGAVSLVKMKSRKGNTKISYRVAGPA